MNYLVDLRTAHSKPVYLGPIIAFQAQMACGNSGHCARGADNLKMILRLRRLVRGEIGQVLFEKPAHQCKTRSVVFHVGKLIAQRGYSQRHADPIHHTGGGDIGFCLIKSPVQPHNGLRPIRFGHLGNVDPDQFSRSATDVDHQQVMCLAIDQRRT